MAASDRSLPTCFFLIFLTSVSVAWDNGDLELFDLVEEVNANFYEVLDVSHDATTAEVKRAYRRLSLQIHPDKNKAEDAEVKFRQLVAVYEVLKDDQRRQQYNHVLEYGLPDWRQPVYYYRHVRKMGLAELAVALFLILTVGQYIVSWSIFFERKLTVECKEYECLKKNRETLLGNTPRVDLTDIEEDVFASKMKKSKKGKKYKQANEDEVDEILQEKIEAIPRPKLVDLWPIMLTRGLFHCIVNIPTYINDYKENQREKRERIKQMEEDEREREMIQEAEPTPKPKKRQRVALPEFSEDMYSASAVSGYEIAADALQEDGDANKKHIKSGQWSEEEVAFLLKAVNKFPGGTQKRWEKIADMVGRPMAEVTQRAKSIKGTVIMNVSASLQGTTADVPKPINFKKGYATSDDIISQNVEDEIINDEINYVIEVKKSSKSGDRTTTISKKRESENVEHSSKQIPNDSKQNADKVASNEITEKGKTKDDSDTWTQNQQKILEWTIKQYPKGTEQRWEKIAEHIPGKSKDDCILRFKYLADLVKKRKEHMQMKDA